LNTPVAFVVFNRPECTARTLAAIREARPPKLLVIADGPRSGHPADADRCAEVRALIDRQIDWPCEVERDFAGQNMGCARRVAGGLTWAFSRCERLVVIEDDCLPDPSFFPFCDELLERYAEDSRVGQICGCPRYFSAVQRDSSYIFSRYGAIWGWASWRRAWASYSLSLETWPRFASSGGLEAVVQSRAEYELRSSLYQRLHDEPPDTWDFQWGYAKLSQGMLSVVPCRNLVENIGFSGGGTHVAAGSRFPLDRLQVHFPLRHPEFVLPDLRFDRAYSRAFTDECRRPIWRRAARRLSRVWGAREQLTQA
jgi:hypothetical protein